MEQQRSAYYDLGLDSMPFDDFLLTIAPFKSKTLPQFPPPEKLYEKKFAFLNSPLKKDKKILESPLKVPVMKKSVSTNSPSSSRKNGLISLYE